VSALDVEIYGLSKLIKGNWLLDNFLPGANLSMIAAEAIEEIQRAFLFGGRGAPAPLEGAMQPDAAEVEERLRAFAARREEEQAAAFDANSGELAYQELDTSLWMD
jgi:hypothetical protein